MRLPTSDFRIAIICAAIALDQSREQAMRVETPPPKSIVETSAVEFESIKAFRPLTGQGRQRKAREMLRGIRGPALLAAELLTLDQDQLVKKVRTSYNELRASLNLLARACERAEGIAQIIRAVETTLTIALATVEGEASESAG
jgi:hypothetical protein